jgi:hypothetical protein
LPEEKRIPLNFHLLYLILAGIRCYVYYLRVIQHADMNSPNSINAVLGFETGKPYQFRLFVPFIFFILKPLTFIPQKILFLLFSISVVYCIQLVYYKLIRLYFHDNRRLLFYAPVILYAMLFNYIILNQTLQYYDFTAILICTAGIYFIVKKKFGYFAVVFMIGLINKESAAFLIFSYLLFNYKEIFKIKIILRTILLAVLIVAVKAGLAYIFRNNPGDNIEICYYENVRILQNHLFEWGVIKPVFLNFGGLHIIMLILFLSGMWKNYPDLQKLLVNLTILPFYLIGIYITYIVEVRVYTELIPMITTLFLIYLSNFKKSGLIPRQTSG